MSISTLLFSLFLIAASGGLLFVHWRRWKEHRADELPAAEIEYLRRQFRRRMQASGMIGIVGFALIVGDTFIPWMNDPVVTAGFWIGVVLVTVWIALLAIVDLLAARLYVERICENDILEQTRLHAEMLKKKQRAQLGSDIQANTKGNGEMTKLE
jgi:hypothetical protein